MSFVFFRSFPKTRSATYKKAMSCKERRREFDQHHTYFQELKALSPEDPTSNFMWFEVVLARQVARDAFHAGCFVEDWPGVVMVADGRSLYVDWNVSF